MATTEKVTLVTKLATIMGELGNIEKKGFNKAQNYRFVRESDVVAALVPLLAKHHIYLHTTITSHQRDPLYQTQSGMTMWITTVWVDGTWIDGDTGETLPVATFVGTGADTGDKGVYKAMTGCEKYMLMKGFLISTGDDPESDEKVDKAAAASGAAASGARVVRGSQPGVERGGKASVATAAQINEIIHLVKDLGLDQEAFVKVIKSVTGQEPDEDQTPKDLLTSLSADHAKGMIAALTAADVETVDDQGESAPDDVQDGDNLELPVA
jgi:hypothetical protein